MSDELTALAEAVYGPGVPLEHTDAIRILAELQASGYSLVTADRLAALEAIEAAAREFVGLEMATGRWWASFERLRSLLSQPKAGEG